MSDRYDYHKEYYQRTKARRQELALARARRNGVPPRKPADPMRRKETRARWVANNVARFRKLQKEWRKRNPEKARAHSYRAGTQQFLAKQAGCSFGAIPQELVDAKIALLDFRNELRRKAVANPE